MRLTSDFWVSALMRRVFSAGGFAAVLRKGAHEAGAVYVLWRDRFGSEKLFGPAPQSAYEDARPQDRLFTVLSESPDEIQRKLERETRFDPDIWIVELECEAELLAELLEISES